MPLKVMYYAYLVLQQQNSIANNLFYSKDNEIFRSGLVCGLL